ncbi:hypothetical protein VXS03_07655 [Photobacterium sp. S4TG1]|uniref:hypothetical protein n=1 Tax=Photobacterium sp. S4TG1 TaxID=3114587 RepID=UPI002E198514|nr:hypothetical protein [Photobacterium sp. S4TG1]
MIANDFIYGSSLSYWAGLCVVMQYKSGLKYKYFEGIIEKILKLDFFSKAA